MNDSVSFLVWLLPAAFFLGLSAFALFIFFILKKTVKIVIRLILVGLIMIVALVGSLVIWFSFGSNESTKRPAVHKSR